MNNETSYFLFQIISFKKYFYVSLGNNFFTVFVEAPVVVEALGNCLVCPPLNPAMAGPTVSLILTIRYDTRCYFNVLSEADTSQLNLPHGTDN